MSVSRFSLRPWVACALFLSVVVVPAHAQNWGTVQGTVTETPDGLPVPGVTILVEGTNYGTASGEEGRYRLRIPVGRYAFRFSAIGYATRTDSVVVRRGETTQLDVTLSTSVLEMDDLVVEGEETAEAGVYTLDPEVIRAIPAPFNDGFRALKVVPGVASNNEMSYQFSVRGGGYNENLIFVNGFEVYMPFRPRQGEQEGLGLVNPDLADRLTLYTGGFSARYGGKLSSALLVDYRRPEEEPLRGAAALSTLDASFNAGSSLWNNRVGWQLGVRKARARRFFSTQELQGNYQPDYTDVQGLVSVRLAPGHEVEALGIWADHEFRLDPRSRQTYFGTISTDPNTPSNLQGLWVNFSDDSDRADGYASRFGGVRVSNRLTDRLRAVHDVSYFQTDETEFFDIRGQAVLYQVDPAAGDPDTGAGFIRNGNASMQDFADNRVQVDTWTAQGRWIWTADRHSVEGGWLARSLRFEDDLNERGVVVGRGLDGGIERVVVDSLTDAATLQSTQAALYAEHVIDAAPTRDRLVVTSGLRLDYFDFNGEWTLSPRVMARYRLTTETTLSGSLGLYHQAPTYRELRGVPVPGETILGALNRDLRSQRSLQAVIGMEHFFTQKRLYLRSEVYAKHLSRLISYNVDNVRIEYSGENDADGYTYGLDVQLRGELVPGIESWINYGFMVANEDVLAGFETPQTQGANPRPMDQRHTFSMFMQDYVPTDPTWKIHLRTLFGSGFPYTPPIPGERLGGLTLQVPGDRLSARYTSYRRVDMGVSKEIVMTENGPTGPITLTLTGEVLNIFNMVNTVAYAWVPNNDGIWQRIPTRLTPRTVNVRVRMAF
ncbi:MAG: TonB-dependent receptor [Bacteroidota bacterium]